MDKPEKKLNPEGLDRPIQYGYNKACDDWEKYLAFYKPEIDYKLRTFLCKVDSCLSYLRHRGGIKWEDLKTITVQEVDDLIGQLRELYVAPSPKK